MQYPQLLREKSTTSVSGINRGHVAVVYSRGNGEIGGRKRADLGHLLSLLQRRLLIGRLLLLLLILSREGFSRQLEMLSVHKDHFGDIVDFD